MAPRTLPQRAYTLFETKGPENAARVRRIVGVVSAMYVPAPDWRELRVLDLGCGEGLFALEAALHGARVTAIDGRAERLSAGRSLAEELHLSNVDFIQADVQTYPFEDHGPFDLILFLGLMYHLDAPALFEVTHRAAGATRRMMIVETHLATTADTTVRYGDRIYSGWRYREHHADDAPVARRLRLRASLANESSVWLTLESSIALLRDVGFATVLECHAPAQPFQDDDRRTLVALKGDAPPIATFPWVNGASDEEVHGRGRPRAQLLFMPPHGKAREDVLLRLVVTLGRWVLAHPELVIGSSAISSAGTTRAPSAAIWRREDLDAYVGALRRVPPLLAVEIANGRDPDAALHEQVTAYLGAGVATVWIALLESRSVLVVTPAGVTRFRGDDVMPGSPDLPGLSVRVTEILPPLAN